MMIKLLLINIIFLMESYFSFTRLLSLRDSEGSNLPLFKDARAKRYQSVERLLELLEVAASTRPRIPSPIITLNPLDRISIFMQLNGTTRCHFPWLTVTDTGPMLVEFHLFWYFTHYSVFLFLQLQHFHNQYSLPHFQKRFPILGCIYFCWCLRFISQTNSQN